MKLPSELLLLTLSLLPSTTTTSADPQPRAQPPSLHRRSASFLSLRGLTNLENDYSTPESFTHPTKFFHESTFSSHYDGRFASTELPHNTRLFHMRLMLKAYIDTMDRIGVRSWLMHGCLLGWWWNGHIMPWDTDIDLMVDEMGIAELGSWWNMSVHHFTAQDFELDKLPPEVQIQTETPSDENAHISKRMLHEKIAQADKRYLLEINPSYTNISTRDKENVIDARWIDTSTGLFIDITTIHIQPPIRQYNHATNSYQIVEQENQEDLELYTKDQHAYSHSQIFPLRTSTFEGITVHVPYDYEELLLDEYGPQAILEKWYRGWKFDEGVHGWRATDEAEAMEREDKAKESKERYLVRVGERARKKIKVE